MTLPFADVVETGLSSWWAPVLVFAAGLISFASPCVFPLIPGYLAFVAGGRTKEEARSLGPILLFVGGFTTVFTILGVFAPTLAEHLPPDWRSAAMRVAGSVVVVFGAIMVMYALRLGRPGLYAEGRPFLQRVRPGKTGALPLGMAFALSWTPCLGPVLGAVLTLAAVRGGAVRGGFLLLVYSAGLALPFILVGLGLTRLMSGLAWVSRNYRWITGTAGVVMVLIGVLMASGIWERLVVPWLNRFQTVRLPI